VYTALIMLLLEVYITIATALDAVSHICLLTTVHAFPPKWVNENGVCMISLVFCCFQQVSDMHSHLLSSLYLDLSEIKPFNCP